MKLSTQGAPAVEPRVSAEVPAVPAQEPVTSRREGLRARDRETGR